MLKVLAYIWQLPQNLLGLLLRLIYKGNDSQYKDAIVRRSTKMPGGISLGKYIIINQWAGEMDKQHEYGHCIQSKRWGWLYLPVIGLCSITWAGLYGTVIESSPNGYYKCWTERRADKLGGVNRGN